MKKLQKASFCRRLLKVCKSKPLLALIIVFACTVTSPVVAKIPNIEGIQYFTNQSENGGNLIESGKKLYDLGQYSQAVKVLQQAANRYERNNQKLQQAATLINISLAYQQLGLWQQADGAINKSLDILKNFDNSQEKSQTLAQILEVQGRMQFMQGKAETALISWKQAGDIYQKLGLDGAFIRNQINFAQALQALGRFLQSQKKLMEVKENLIKQKDSQLKVLGLRKLGNVLQIAGDLKESEEILQQSFAIAKSLSLDEEVSETLFSLGNTARTEGNIEKAFLYYQQAEVATNEPITRLQAQLNQLKLLVDDKRFRDASNLSGEIKSLINQLPLTRVAVNAEINFARSLMENELENNQDVAKILADALKDAEKLQDKRAESYALGTLGRLYEKTKQFDYAQKLTGEALLIARNIRATEITYLWQWQTARLYKQQGDIEQAISYYHRAVKSLESLRDNLVVNNPDNQLSFQESVEPVYRQLIDLLLQSSNDTSLNKGEHLNLAKHRQAQSLALQKQSYQKEAKNQLACEGRLCKCSDTLTGYCDEIVANKQVEINSEKLREARKLLVSLQVAELDNFFRTSCLKAVPEEIDLLVDEKDKTAAVIYATILPKSLNVIVKLPNQELRLYKNNVDEETVKGTIKQLTQDLRDVTRKARVKRESGKLYNWLIKPLETDLKDNGIKNLVFVLETQLQNIPMSVLYDKQNDKYLIEEYAISLAAGLQLIDPKPLKEIKLNTLTAGVVQERTLQERTFSPLKFVQRELQQIQSQVPKNTKLLDEKFTVNSFKKRLKSSNYSVVHLATHGEFSSNAEETFILTWDQLLNVKEFDQLLRVSDSNQSSKIELLVLSACETAQGDERAALGLAGVAVKAGARSTLATLWAVDDESTANLMSEFYSQLKTGINKAQALQNAQKQLLTQKGEPYYWAPFVLLGNWL